MLLSIYFDMKYSNFTVIDRINLVNNDEKNFKLKILIFYHK